MMVLSSPRKRAITTDSGIWPAHGDDEGWEISVAELPKMSVRLSGATNPRHCIELAKIAEANGYHCVWFAENAFGRGVLPAASACAMATQRAASASACSIRIIGIPR
jgi:Luciferase-like monooxygenase